MFKCCKRRKARNCCVCIVGKRPSYLFQFNSKSQYFSSPSKRATYKPIISLWTFLPYLFSVPRVSFAFVPSFLCFFIVFFPTHRNNIHLNLKKDFSNIFILFSANGHSTIGVFIYEYTVMAHLRTRVD